MFSRIFSFWIDFGDLGRVSGGIGGDCFDDFWRFLRKKQNIENRFRSSGSGGSFVDGFHRASLSFYSMSVDGFSKVQGSSLFFLARLWMDSHGDRFAARACDRVAFCFLVL